MEGVPHVEAMEQAPLPDLLEAHKDKVVTIFGVTGTIGQLAKMCPKDLNDPSISLESKNEFVVKAENEAGLEIEPEHEAYYAKVLEKHGLTRRFTVQQSPESPTAENNHIAVQSGCAKQIEPAVKTARLGHEQQPSPKTETTRTTIEQHQAEQLAVRRQTEFEAVLAYANETTEIKRPKQTTKQAAPEVSVINSEGKQQIHMQTIDAVTQLIKEMIPVVHNKRFADFDATQSSDVPVAELSYLAVPTMEKIEPSFEDSEVSIANQDEHLEFDEGWVEQPFESPFIAAVDHEINVEQSFIEQSETATIDAIEFDPANEPVLKPEDEGVIEVFEQILEVIPDLEPARAEAAHELMDVLIEKVQAIQTATLNSIESAVISAGPTVEQVAELEQLLTELCVVVGKDCSEEQIKRFARLMIKREFLRLSQDEAPSLNLLFSDEGTHEGLNQLSSWLKSIKLLMPPLHLVIGKYALQHNIRQSQTGGLIFN